MEPFAMDEDELVQAQEQSNPSFGNLDESSSGDDISMDFVGAPNTLQVTGHFKPSTRVSLLVESLVRSLVTAYEHDAKKSTVTYEKICEELFELGLIDGSWKVNELEGVRVQFQRSVFELLELPLMDPPTSAAALLLVQNTHYQGKFDELGNIAAGTFGDVSRVRNKLDGREYAVKKIPIKSERLSSIKNYLAEVKILGILKHPNIVEYRDAWLDLLIPKKVNNNGNNAVANISITDESEGALIIDLTQSTLSIASIRTEPETEPSQSNKDAATTDNNTDSDCSLQIITDPSNSEESSSPRYRSAAPVPVQQIMPLKKIKPWATLFIQMTLCHGTLDQLLTLPDDTFARAGPIPSNAPVLTSQVIQEILIQTLRGLNHIHSKGAVHHDIKPSNILFVSDNSGSLLVQIGDFGLACVAEGTSHNFSRGTALYAAEEQLLGFCDRKSDMYSLGIVLFELLVGAATVAQRTERILDLRRAGNPAFSDMMAETGLLDTVKALLKCDPSERPAASTLLEALEGAKDRVSDFDAIRLALEAKERENETLRELLQANGPNQ